MGNIIVKEHTLGLMEKSMLGNTRMDCPMVREHTLYLMEKRILENSRIINLGTGHITTKKETSF